MADLSLYVEEFNTQNSCFRPSSARKFLKYVLWILLFLLFSSLAFAFNIYISKARYGNGFKDIFIHFFKSPTDPGWTYDSDFEPIRRVIWINLAAIVAAIGLSISSSIAQALTQNPLADATTLGMVDASIFGIILMKSFFWNAIGINWYHWNYLLFSFAGSLIILLAITYAFRNEYKKDVLLKIILFGLIMNIFFRALVHALKAYSVNSINTIYSLSIGGPENIYELYSHQFQVIKISFIVLFFFFFLAFAVSKQFNICELGVEQAKTLGINYRVLKLIGFTIILFTTTIAIVVAGNISFIGLLSSHVVRMFFKTRKYQIIIPASAAFSSLIFLISVTLNILFPSISSSIFILFFGSLSLLYLSQKK